MTDDVKNHYEAERARRSRFFFMVPGELLFSDAVRSIASHGPSMTAFLMVLARQPIPPRAKERKRLEKAGLWPPKAATFSFPIREARAHGLTEKGLYEGLLRVHTVGIIDRLHPGSAMRKGDFATYRLSERWRDFGKPTFKAIPWPKAESRSKEEEKKRRDAEGKFIKRRGRKILVAAVSATTDDTLMAKTATTPHPVAAETAVNNPFCARRVAAENATFLSFPCSPEEIKKMVPDLEPRKEGIGPRARVALKLSDLRARVESVLPSPNRRTVASVTEQLDGVRRGHLDRGKVQAALSFDLLLSDDIVADLFKLLDQTTCYTPPRAFPWTGTPTQRAELLSSWGPT